MRTRGNTCLCYRFCSFVNIKLLEFDTILSVRKIYLSSLFLRNYFNLFMINLSSVQSLRKIL